MNDDLNSAKRRNDLWKQGLHATLIRKEDMNRIIINYFVMEGFAEAADKFRIESGTNYIDLQTIMERDAARQAIQDGDIDYAIEKIKAFNPKILDKNPQLSFHLQKQKFIELIRQGRIMDALECAQKEMTPRGEKHPDLWPELERTLTLLSFEDPTRGPHGYLLDMSLRNILAHGANAAMLRSQNYHPDPILSGLLKMLKWLQDVVLFRYPCVADFTNPTYSLRI